MSRVYFTWIIRSHGASNFGVFMGTPLPPSQIYILKFWIRLSFLLNLKTNGSTKLRYCILKINVNKVNSSLTADWIHDVKCTWIGKGVFTKCRRFQRCTLEKNFDFFVNYWDKFKLGYRVCYVVRKLEQSQA